MYNISKNQCVGCGICENICSEGIEIKEGIARIKDYSTKCLEKAVKACPQKAIKDITQDLFFAIGTDDNKTIKPDDHIGMSRYFQIWHYSSSNGNLVLRETRDNPKYAEDETRVHGDPNKEKAVSSVLGNVDVLVGKMFGPNIVRLKRKYVCAVVRDSNIETALELIKANINEITDEYIKDERKGIILH